jgi:hypothetical protein
MRGLLWVGISVVISCGGGGSGSDVDGHVGSGGTRSITYDFNGTSLGGSLLATATTGSNTAGGNVFGIESSDAQAHTLAITVAPTSTATTVTAGTYEVGMTAPLAAFQFTDGSNGSWAAGAAAAGSGSITITELGANGTECKGTFEATMVGSGGDPGSGAGVITNGVFDVVLN